MHKRDKSVIKANASPGALFVLLPLNYSFADFDCQACIPCFRIVLLPLCSCFAGFWLPRRYPLSCLVSSFLLCSLGSSPVELLVCRFFYCQAGSSRVLYVVLSLNYCFTGFLTTKTLALLLFSFFSR